jgi:hypothetical protein
MKWLAELNAIASSTDCGKSQAQPHVKGIPYCYRHKKKAMPFAKGKTDKPDVSQGLVLA